MENFDSAKSSLKDSTEIPKFDNTFGKNIFNASVMEDYIEERYIQNYMDFMNGKCKIAQETLEKLAEGMLNWAIKNNATHYSHWFQPITNSVAEKHESFITLDPLTNKAIFKFNWKNLLKQESDASCFPHNSKVKNYRLSRGYTAWDPSTFVFIYDNVLYIPAVFISHDEHALDHKIPLLKAESKLKKHATKFMKLFNADVLEVQTMLGWQQEFYLLDKKLVEKRIDLLQLDKTIVGSSLISEQKMDDYCFGSINKRVKNFLSEVEYQCNILGIPLKTRYKKEAINQYEFSHSYIKVNVATNHNVLLMNIMKKVAYDQGLKVIFHETPFKNSKSSSKFCNFSFLTNEGLNLFDCGDTLEERVRFFSFLCIFLKAVNDNKDLLKSSVISYESEVQKHESNKHSSVVSVYLGENFTLMLEDLEKNTNFDFLNEQEKKNEYHSVIENIPKFLKEDYNKNKTATLAFLGNRFVFRSVGSEQNCAKPMSMLISILANQIKLFLSELDLLVKNENLSVKDAIFKISREYFFHSKNIIYNQDKHPEEFLSNEEKTELMNRDCEIEKFKLLKSEKVISLFSSLNVLSKEEIFLRHDIEMETYLIKLETESKILYELISSYVIPSAIKYQNILLENYCKIKENNFDFEYSIYQPETIRKINYHITILHTQLKDLNKNLQEMNKLSLEDRMNTAKKILKNNFKEIKTSSEELELIVDDKIWPLVKYKEYFRDL